MRKDDPPAKCYRAANCWRGKALLVMLARVRSYANIVFAAVLLCFGCQGVWAASTTVQRSTRAIPHRFTVHPNGASVAANQTQRFEVTDAQGKPVAVSWNVSGIGCSGMACGTVDSHGVYHTPSTLPEPRVVILEGVLVSDPNYSVLTEVRLEDAVPLDPSAPTVAVAPAPEERQNPVATAKLTTPPNTVAAAPTVGGQLSSRNTELPPLSGVVAAPPGIGVQRAVRSVEIPLQGAVAAAPAVGVQGKIARSADLPLPGVVAAPPGVGAQKAVRSVEIPLQGAVAAAPAVGVQGKIARSADLPLPGVVGAPPGVGAQRAVRSVEIPLQGAVAAAPAVGVQGKIARSAALPLPGVVAAPPGVGVEKAVRSVEIPLQGAVGAAPAVGVQGKIARSAALPLPGVVGAPPGVGAQRAVRSVEIPLQGAVGAAPAGGQGKIARSTGLPLPGLVAAPQIVGSRGELPPLPSTLVPVSPAPVSVQASLGKSPQLPDSAAKKASAVPGSMLLPMPEAAGTPAGKAVSGQRSPVVTYRDGQLTIDAENVTMAEVLRLVAERTGAKIDVPPGSGLERIFEHNGPGQADDVLSRLLNGSSYDFIIVGSPQRPHDPAQVLLSLHTPASGSPVPTAVAQAEVQPKIPGSSVLWTQPEPAAPAAAIPAELDSRNMEPPKEQLSPEELGKRMRERAQQLREQLQPQQ